MSVVGAAWLADLTNRTDKAQPDRSLEVKPRSLEVKLKVLIPVLVLIIIVALCLWLCWLRRWWRLQRERHVKVMDEIEMEFVDDLDEKDLDILPMASHRRSNCGGAVQRAETLSFDTADSAWESIDPMSHSEVFPKSSGTS
mmetsp:Transcript_16543/g.33421  ORF Transcript_16543/g.33421 Transcript_16543/m.33421 type:complete len:141 (+) Transcript_16543:63-485(+)|eukprot:CAMPEP_0119078446 /NCGR_PEP_ID=MMETSP1178-20130426/100902_1 /TAXON_ID=33656 /ORGANISM="unid sp, Strain CCMP2000" /LENGTH=140 /DNA_ID=CAMNT_0007060895 /DNA_START=63 /DNA_END=485 /DNA_ORIENTATION=-